MKRNKLHKLTLDSTTLRNLSSTDLAGAAGGAVNSSNCATGMKGCSARCDSEVHLSCYWTYSSGCN